MLLTNQLDIAPAREKYFYHKNLLLDYLRLTIQNLIVHLTYCP